MVVGIMTSFKVKVHDLGTPKQLDKLEPRTEFKLTEIETCPSQINA